MKAVSEAEARSLLVERGANEMLAQSKGYKLSGAWVMPTSWKVDGDLLLDRKKYGGGLVILDGDLDVSGLFEDTGEDSSGTTFIGVMGSLRAGDVWTGDFLFVQKDLLVKRTLYGNSGGNHTLFVDGRIEADAIVMDGHSFECERVRARLRIDDEGAPDPAAVRAAMAAGRSLR